MQMQWDSARRKLTVRRKSTAIMSARVRLIPEPICVLPFCDAERQRTSVRKLSRAHPVRKTAESWTIQLSATSPRFCNLGQHAVRDSESAAVAVSVAPCRARLLARLNAVLTACSFVTCHRVRP
jgi:hypothetical protein